jgi:site-specific DNA-adenine methylase
MAIPYMGSKRKSAQKIYQTIINFNPDKKTIVDLFCGGFAIGELFYKNGFNVIANDKNKYVTALLDETINKGLNEQKCLEFITRAKFEDVLKNSDNYEDWYVGYVMCIWSFGNNQKAYIFGKETEPYKRAGHELVINKDPKLLKQLLPNIPQKYIDGIIKQTDWHKRRIALGKVAKVLKNRILELERLERLQQLEQLERLEQLQQLERLEIYSNSYNEVEIPKNAIIYCDPPYQGTAEYKEGAFNHKEFWNWVREISKSHKIYISEYNAPEDFEVLLSFSQKSTLQGGNQKHNNQPDEKLFVPIGQEKYII